MAATISKITCIKNSPARRSVDLLLTTDFSFLLLHIQKTGRHLQASGFVCQIGPPAFISFEPVSTPRCKRNRFDAHPFW